MAGNNLVEIIIRTLYQDRGTKKAISDLERLEKTSKNSYDALRKSFGIGMTSSDRFKLSFSKLSESAKGAYDKLDKFTKGVGFMTTTVGIAVAALVGAGFAIKKAFDFAYAGAQITRLQESFQTLATSAGVSGDHLYEALNKAARGTIANADLILSTNRAMMLGLGADSEQLGQLMEVAMFRGRAMGLSTTQAFNDIVTGIGRASPLILDNLGIMVDAEKTYADYAKSIGKTKDELTKAERTQALFTRVLEEGQRQIDIAGGVAEDTAQSYEKLNAQLKTATDNFKQQAGEALAPLVRVLGDALERSNDYERAVQRSGLSYKEFNIAAHEAGMSVNEFVQYTLESADAAEEAGSGLDGWGRKLSEVQGEIEDNTEALKEQSKAYQTILTNMFKVQDANESFLEGEADRAKEQEDIENDKVRLAIETTKKKEDLLKDLAELDRDIAKARGDNAYKLDQIDTDAQERAVRNATTKEAQARALERLAAARADNEEKRAKTVSDGEERIHDMMVRREDLLERIQELQDDAVTKQVELDEKLNELADEGTKAIEDQAKSRKEMVYRMLEQKAAADGLINTDELRFLQDTAVQMGLVDRASADMAVAASEAADMMWEQFQKPGEMVGDIQDALNKVVQGSPYRAQIVIEQVGGIGVNTGIRTLTSPFPVRAGEQQGFRVAAGQGLQHGGSFTVPGAGTGDRPYIVNLEPGELVQVTPRNERPHNTIQVNVANIRSLSDIDYLVQEVNRRMTGG